MLENYTFLRKYIEKYKGTKVYKNAVSFLQYLINKNCTVDNMNTLKTKKDLLKQLGLDYVPDVRYILEREKHHFPKRKYYDDPLYEDMFGLPVKAFQQIWDKYHEILGL